MFPNVNTFSIGTFRYKSRNAFDLGPLVIYRGGLGGRTEKSQVGGPNYWPCGISPRWVECCWGSALIHSSTSMKTTKQILYYFQGRIYLLLFFFFFCLPVYFVVKVSEDILISTWEYSRSDTWKKSLPRPLRTLLWAVKEPGELCVDPGFPNTHFGPCNPRLFPLVLNEMTGHIMQNTLGERLLLDTIWTWETWHVYGLAVKWGCCHWRHSRPLLGLAFCVQGGVLMPSTADGLCKHGFVLCLQFILKRQKLFLVSLHISHSSKHNYYSLLT